MDGLHRLEEIVDSGERVACSVQVLFDDTARNVREHLLNLVYLFGNDLLYLAHKLQHCMLVCIICYYFTVR